MDNNDRPAALPRLSVIGTGYLGATHAICMAAIGFEVVGLDVDQAKIAALSAGHVPFFEPGLPELLQSALATGRLTFSTDFAAAADADVHFLCVGTPQQRGSQAADLTYVRAAVDALGPHLTRRCLVVGKSTVPVGTARELTTALQLAAPAGSDVELAWNPEFLREGFAVKDTLHPDRLVFGVDSEWAHEQLRAAFAPVIERHGVPVIVTDLATAELVKVAANSFLATKISYINAMSEICDLVGADVLALADALGKDARIGARFLRPGLGFGGGCLPKDIRAFAHRASELGGTASVAFLREVDLINGRCRTRAVDLVREALGGELSGKRIAALGAAFKPDSDDIRDAPALAVAEQLQQLGAIVTVFDPEAMDNVRRVYPQLHRASSVIDAIIDADVVILLTEWQEFRHLNPADLHALVNRRIVVDTRHALDADRWRAAGWRYLALGAPERIEASQAQGVAAHSSSDALTAR
jgi:UDPglucose 6-dehydrogenase